MLDQPRDMREWMTAQVRRQNVTYQGMSNLITTVVGEFREEKATADARHPAAPVELVSDSAIYTETTSSRRWARVQVDFPDVTFATDGTTITVAHYELWGKDLTSSILATTRSAVPGVAIAGLTLPGLAATPANKAKEAAAAKDWKLLRNSEVSSFREDGFIPGAVWKFRIRAIGEAMATPGEWSEEFNLQMNADDTPPPQPTAPALTVERGTITVVWGGQSVAGPMPSDFRYLEVAQGEGSSPENLISRFYRGGGFTIVSAPYYKTQFFRFRAVDETGNKGPWSAQSSAFTTPIVDTDVLLSEIDAAKTRLINVDAGVSILSDTILTRHLVITEDMTAALAEFLHVRAGMIEANAVEADKILAGAVTASKLEATLALVTAIIAGNPMGTHAQMDQNGFRVFAEDLTDGIPNEVVRMGVASTDDYFAITRANGTLAATISQDGVGSFTQLNATDTFYYRGKEITSFITDGPRGSLYKAELSADIDGITTEYGLVEAEYLADGTDRQIKLSCGLRLYPTAGGSEVYLKVRYTIDGSAPTINSPMIFDVGLGDVSTKSFDHKSFTHTIRPTTMNGNLTVPNTRVRFLMTVSKGNGDEIKVRQGLSTYLYVDDIGKGIVHSPSFSPGGGVITVPAPPPPPPAPSKQTYVSQWGCVDSRSYDGGGGWYNYNGGQMYQGLSPAGYGNLKSMAIFNDITGALAGASINYIRVYFNFNHWYYNSGGTARIGLHGHGGVQGGFSSNGVVTTSGGWPKPGARWVDIPAAHWWGFQSGAYRGVTLEGDGGYGTYGYADRPTIEISYTK